MGLNVALIDKSEITQKMISHSLHYYSAKIHRFENLEDLLAQSSKIKPDVAFIDWDLKKGKESIALEAQNKINDFPLIVLYRNSSDPQLEKAKNRIKKPIDANALRKMVIHMVPKAGRFKIDQFLVYPNKKSTSPEKNPTFSLKQPSSEGKKTLISKQISPDLKKKESTLISNIASQNRLRNEKLELPKKKANEGNLIEREHIIDEKEFTAARVKDSNEGFQLPKKDNDDENLIFKAREVHHENKKPSQEEMESTISRTVQDLLVHKGESMLMKALKEYQSTQEFQNSVDKKFQDYLNQKIEFFLKQFLEKEIESLKKQLPTVAKELIQFEIDKLLNEN